MKLHRCEVTRARDLYSKLSLIELQARLAMLRARGERAKHAMETGTGTTESGLFHNSNKALADYSTNPRIVYAMCKRDYALTRLVYREKGGKGF